MADASNSSNAPPPSAEMLKDDTGNESDPPPPNPPTMNNVSDEFDARPSSPPTMHDAGPPTMYDASDNSDALSITSQESQSHFLMEIKSPVFTIGCLWS